MEKTIYSYQDSTSFLRDRFLEKQKKNPSFSIRSWANILGMKSHGSIQQIIAGNRLLPKSYLSKVSKSLEMKENEIKYLEILIDFERSKNSEEKIYHYTKLKKLQPQNVNYSHSEVESYKFFENPLHTIILAMIRKKGFKLDYHHIKKNLRVKVSVHEIQDVMERLAELKFIQIENGEVIVCPEYARNKIDTPSQAVQKFHQKMSLLAHDEVVKQTIDQREFNSFSFNMLQNQIPEAKQKIRSFIKEFLEEFATTDEESTTYHLNNQLFSLINEKDKQ